MKTLKKSLLAGIVVSGLMIPSVGMAAQNTGTWMSAGVSTVGLIYSNLLTWLNGGQVVWMPAINLDPAQLASEAGVLYQMHHVKDEWDPEPAQVYQKAAENNGSGGGGGGSGGGCGVSVSGVAPKSTFVVSSLKNVGIESIGVGPTLPEISASDTQTKILGELEYLQLKTAAEKEKDPDEENTNKDEVPGAGSCDASYSVCLQDLTNKEMDEIAVRQKINEQNFGTAAIAHAELGLKSVQQAIANDGGSAMNKKSTSASTKEIKSTLTAGKSVAVQDLTGVVGTATDVVSAMKIVTLMNMELAQRLNQGNMLQGATLTVEAARALTDTAGITD